MPLAAHHRLLGTWAAARLTPDTVTRHEARELIERVFEAAVMDQLRSITLTNLRIAVLLGDHQRAPAIAVICDDIGQLELGWIEKTNLLSHTLFGSVAPVGWRAAAYTALERTLGTVLAMFNFDDMLDELSAYYWDGETTDEAARKVLVEWHGADPDEIEILPSHVREKRPDFMTASPEALKRMPKDLARRLRALSSAHAAHRAHRAAWQFDGYALYEYMPEMEESSCLAPLTLVPFEHFARELDDIGRPGMEMGFATVAGLFELPAPEMVDAWLESFRLGIDVLRAAQDLIAFDPTRAESRR